MERRVIVITGGSRGIGAATAIMAAGRGYDSRSATSGTARRPNESSATAPRRVPAPIAVRADVASESDIVAYFDTVNVAFGRIDVVVNNAGILHRVWRCRWSDRERVVGGVVPREPERVHRYAATKGAIDTMTIGLAKEVATEHVRVNAVRPGLIHTDIHDLSWIENRVGRLAAGVPMQRGGTADEVAETIPWLASEAASYVTGTLVNCTGGR